MLQTANDMVCLAHAAYEDPSVVGPLAKSWGYESCDFYDCKGTQAYVMMKESRTVIAFRGTEVDRLEDWATDLRRLKVDHPFGKVHKGFAHALSNVWRDISPLIEGRSQPFYITGHSLGGALATLAAAETIANGWPLAGLYTFGQPRVGNNLFARTFDKHCKVAFRFVNNNDIVPRVPWFGYRHIGEMIYLTSTGALVQNPSSWRLIKDRLRGRWQRVIADGFKDHSIVTYEQILRTNLLERSNA